MTTRTQQDLAEAVMEDLRLTEAGETPSAADSAYIKRRYANMLAELQDEQTLYWSADAIPLEAFEALVTLMGLVVGPSFGLPKTFTADQLNREIEATKRRIKKRVVKPASGETVAADDSYF